MRKLFIVLPFLLFAIGCGKKSGGVVATGPLTQEETALYLSVYDPAESSRQAFNENVEAYNSVVAQLNEAHKLPPETRWQIVKRNCKEGNPPVCDRTVIQFVPPPQSVPPVQVDPKNKETPKK